MEDIFKDSNTVITPALDEFYSNSFLIKGNPANENVLPAPQVGGANDNKSDIKSLINKLNNVSDISASKISNIQANYTDPLADAKMFTFNPTYKGLNWDRYKSHSAFDELGFDPFRDNEKFYNDNTSIWSDVTRGVKGFGYLALGTAWEGAKDLSKLVRLDFSPNTEGAKNSERILSESMSTRGTFGSSVINFGVNAGFTVGIIGELIVEEMLLAAVGLGGALETGGASLGAAGYLAAVKAGMAGSKIASIPRTTGALLKTFKNLDNAIEAKKYFTQFGRGAAEFLNPLQGTTDLIRNWDNLKGLGQVARAQQSFGAFFKDIRNINRSFSEAKLEGGFVQNTMFEKLLAEAHADGKTPTPEEIDKIKETSLHAGYMTELINFPVIHYTNNITFGALTRPLTRLIGTTEDSIRLLNKTITADITRKEVFQELAGGWKEAFKRGINPRLMAKNTLNYFSANIAEGLQESFQEATSIAMEDYYTKLYNNQNSIVQAHQELSMLDSYGKGVGAQFSGQGAETFLSGFLMGGLMHKSVSGVKGLITGINESSNAVKDLFYSKTNPESFKNAKEAREIKKAEKAADIKKYDKLRNNFIESQNAFFKDAGKMFSRDLAHMSAQEIIDAKAKQAQETGDDKFLIDQTDVSLFENIANAQYFGKFDLYIEHLNKILEADDQGLMEAMGIDDAQAGRQRLQVSIDRAKNIKQRLEKAPKNPFNYNDYKEGTPEYNEMVFMHNAFEDARNAAVFTPYHFDRVLERIDSVSKAFSSIDLVANGNATEFLHLFGEKNIADEVAILFQEKESLKDGTPENEKLAKEKDKQIAALAGLQKTIIEHKGYFQALKETDTVDPSYEKNLKKAFIKYLSTYANIKKSVLKSDKLDEAYKLFHDFYRLNIDSELLSKNVAIVANPDFLRQESLRRYNAIKKIYDNKLELIKKKWDVYFRKIGLNGVFQKLYEAGFAGDPEQMVAYNLSGGKKPVTKLYRTKDFSLVTFADTEDIAKINEIFNDYEDITGITKEKEEAAKKAEEAAAKKAEEEAEAARVAEKAKAVENFTPETKAKLVAAYDKYERKDQETFEEYIESAPEAKRIIAAEKQPEPAPAPTPVVQPPPVTPKETTLEETVSASSKKRAFELANVTFPEDATITWRKNEDAGTGRPIYTTDKNLHGKNVLIEWKEGKQSISTSFNFTDDINDLPDASKTSDIRLKTNLGKERQRLIQIDLRYDAELSDLEKRKEVRAAIQKAGQGEGGQFFVTLSDGTRESAVRISLVGDELGVGNKGESVDLAIIDKVENPDGTVLYDVNAPVTPKETKTETETEGSLFDKLEEDYGKDYSSAIEYATSYLAKETINVDEFLEYLKTWDLTSEGKIGAIEAAIITFNKYNLPNKESSLQKLNIERRRQESLNAIKQRPNETLFTAPYYKEGYNFKQLPTDSIMRTEAEEKEYYEILTNNNTLTDVSIQVKTKEEAEKLINAKYDAELVTLEQPTNTDIKVKKADIERRRKLSKIVQLDTGVSDDDNAIQPEPGVEVTYYLPEGKTTDGRDISKIPRGSIDKYTTETKVFYGFEEAEQQAKDWIKSKYDAELAALESKPETKKEEPKVKEPFPISPQFEGKIIYFSPGLGKTTLVNQYPDQFVDMDVLLYEEFKDEPGFENATPETFGSTISTIYKSVKLNQPAFDAFDAIKNTHYNNAFKKAKALAAQGKTVLTGSGAFISRADFSVKASNEKITKDQLKNKTPGIDKTDLSEAMSGVRRNENRNNILMSVDKDSFTQFLMGNYDILKYINQDITFEQLDELGNFITSDMPEVVEAFNKKMEYLQAKILLFTNLQPGDTVIVLNEKTGENIKTKIMKKRNADSYDLEITPGLELHSLNRNRLNTLINVIPAQGESEIIKVDDLDNADAENNKTKVNDVATETERLKALLEKPFNMKNLFDDSEDPNNCNTKN